MFRRKTNAPQQTTPQLAERITSVIGDGISLRGKISGTGGVRIEGAYDGEIELDGLLVIGATGRVTCQQLKARHVIVAGAMRGDILAERVDIRATGRVWGDVVTTSMSTEDGAFLRGQIQMEEKISLGITQPVPEAVIIAENPENSSASAGGQADSPAPKKSKEKQPAKK